MQNYSSLLERAYDRIDKRWRDRVLNRDPHNHRLAALPFAVVVCVVKWISVLTTYGIGHLVKPYIEEKDRLGLGFTFGFLLCFALLFLLVIRRVLRDYPPQQ